MPFRSLAKKIVAGIVATGLVFVPGIGAAAEDDSPYTEPEPLVAAAPAQASSVALPGVHPLNVAVSPLGPDVAVLVQDAAGAQSIARWSPGSAAIQSVAVPNDAELNSLAWHPRGMGMYAAGNTAIFAFDPNDKEWHGKPLWKGAHPIRRLLVGPRPFLPSYRFFFAQMGPSGRHSIASVDEHGQKFYLVTSTTKTVPKAFDGDEIAPNTEFVADARPVSFHPAGNVMLMADAKDCLLRKPYKEENWADAKPMKDCDGYIAYTPNGAAQMYWKPETPGVEIIELPSGARHTEAGALTFLSAPSLTPDAKGVIGVIKGQNGALELHYQPVNIPLSDVVNAWMFLESDDDQKKLVKHGGLLQPIEGDQLYKLYDTENYYCGGYDTKQPARPYYVTTDIFWEVYASAYEGVFMLAERQQAMPAFKSLVDGAAKELAAKAPQSRMVKVFAAASAVITGRTADNAEAAKIVAGEGSGMSDALGEQVNYAEFSPRGHYTKDDEAKTYFRAVRYLASVTLNPDDLALMNGLSPETRALALKWIGTYRAFIAPSRAPLAWDQSRPQAAYTARTQKDAKLFPLSWGWDNEIFDATVHHADRPMTGSKGPRMLPTGLDFAAALGSKFANNTLAELGQFRNYPELQARIASEGTRFKSSASADGDNLYAKWLRALATQWASDVAAPISGPLWDAKRLQTGLASWATLRHATVLVNDRAVAECSEAGFEAIVMRPPRGYVEPDPATFAAVADGILPK